MGDGQGVPLFTQAWSPGPWGQWKRRPPWVPCGPARCPRGSGRVLAGLRMAVRVKVSRVGPRGSAQQNLDVLLCKGVCAQCSLPRAGRDSFWFYLDCSVDGSDVITPVAWEWNLPSPNLSSLAQTLISESETLPSFQIDFQSPSAAHTVQASLPGSSDKQLTGEKQCLPTPGSYLQETMTGAFCKANSSPVYQGCYSQGRTNVAFQTRLNQSIIIPCLLCLFINVMRQWMPRLTLLSPSAPGRSHRVPQIHI